MRRPLLIFLVAVLLPGLVLGGLALRSIRDQEALLERERSQALQAATERLAHAVATRLDEHQRDFSLRVESLLGREAPRELARGFDDRIRDHWPPASLGFAVDLGGGLFAPNILGRPEARQFLVRNDSFLCQRGTVEVYAVTPKGRINLADLDRATPSPDAKTTAPSTIETNRPPPEPAIAAATATATSQRFAELIGDAQEGVLTRFLDDQLVVWVWYRTPRDPDLVFGAQLGLAFLRANLGELIRDFVPPAPGIDFALLDERGLPVALTETTTATAAKPVPAPDWSRPLASAAIGPGLPQWRVGAIASNPALARRESQRLRGALAAVVVLLVAALVAGGWLVVTDARRQLELARRKSDFVSNVSHELRTPLTSIRLFAELLAEERVTDPDKRRRHLGIIQAEAARLHRLIGNVLDFARHERGPVPLRREPLDLAALAREVLASFTPQFAAEDLRAVDESSAEPVPVAGDPDALAQAVNNLLSNAVKYAASGGELTLRVERSADRAVLTVLDRGPGVPAGCGERIFEEFFRADDALSSGIPGAGLGLTLARRIARAHDGELRHEPRPGGGSIFRLELPLAA